MKLTLSFKGRALKVYHLAEGETLIGRDPDADIMIDSLAVEPRHARIHWDGERARLEDLTGGPGVNVNGETAAEHQLAHGAVIELGKHTLHAVIDEPQGSGNEADDASTAALQAHPVGWLQVLSGDNLGRTLRLDRALTRIGKTGMQTAVIARRDEGYYVSHLEGATPTRVAGSEIGEHSHPLSDGDIIEVANTRLQFFLEKGKGKES